MIGDSKKSYQEGLYTSRNHLHRVDQIKPEHEAVFAEANVMQKHGLRAEENFDLEWIRGKETPQNEEA